MKAYAILSGGGVKGAALAGCVAAAKDMKVEFVGYGGTSAGAIVALLGACGCDANKLRHIAVHQLDFQALLDDKGKELTRVKELVKTINLPSKKRTGYWA